MGIDTVEVDVDKRLWVDGNDALNEVEIFDASVSGIVAPLIVSHAPAKAGSRLLRRSVREHPIAMERPRSAKSAKEARPELKKLGA